MIRIKILKKNDENISKFIFILRNKLYVRKNALSKKKINFNTHKNWIEKFFKKKNILYIIKNNDVMIGFIRLE